MSIVGLHGFLGTVSVWSPFVTAHPSLFAVSLPGHAGAEAPRQVDFLSACADLAAALPSHARSLVGYSMGGRVALGMLAACPGRFDRAMVIGAHLGPRDDRERDAMRPQEEMLTRALDGGLDALVDAFEALPLFASQARLSPSVRAVQRAARLGHSPEAIRRTMSVLGTAHMPDLRGALAATSTPTIFVAGELDEKYVRLAQEAASLSSRHAARVLPGVGHNALLEAEPEVSRLIAEMDSSTPR